MLTLIVGGAASGKSSFAEEWVLRQNHSPRIYLATMQVCDAESQARVHRHQALRAGKGFQTIECPLTLASVALPADGALLLECLGTLVANELYDPNGAGEKTGASVLIGVEHLCRQSRHVTLVSNDVFSAGDIYAGDTSRYLSILASLHRQLAQRADVVCEVVAGLPVYHKGGPLTCF